jgi:hypothetical protein
VSSSGEKEPVLLTVLIETGTLQWYVAGVGLDGNPLPLMRSEPDNLRPYLGALLDEQVNFLRHRLSGVLQRGCDRLWARQKKPCQIVFVADGPFPQAPPELTQQVAAHFVEWMVNPPVAFFLCRDGFDAERSPSLEHVAGEIAPEHQGSLEAGLPRLFATRLESELWETAPPKAGGSS